MLPWGDVTVKHPQSWLRHQAETAKSNNKFQKKVCFKCLSTCQLGLRHRTKYKGQDVSEPRFFITKKVICIPWWYILLPRNSWCFYVIFWKKTSSNGSPLWSPAAPVRLFYCQAPSRRAAGPMGASLLNKTLAQTLKASCQND